MKGKRGIGIPNIKRDSYGYTVSKTVYFGSFGDDLNTAIECSNALEQTPLEHWHIIKARYYKPNTRRVIPPRPIYSIVTIPDCTPETVSKMENWNPAPEATVEDWNAALRAFVAQADIPNSTASKSDLAIIRDILQRRDRS